jgi:hypothetical protein
VNNVHKFERWLKHGVTSVASIYAPVTFGKPPCTLLRGMPDDPQGVYLAGVPTYRKPTVASNQFRTSIGCYGLVHEYGHYAYYG